MHKFLHISKAGLFEKMLSVFLLLLFFFFSSLNLDMNFCKVQHVNGRAVRKYAGVFTLKITHRGAFIGFRMVDRILR